MSDKETTGSFATPRLRRGSAYMRLALLAALVAAAGYAAYRIGLFELRDPERLADAIHRARTVPVLPVLFVLGYVMATVLGLPGTVFTLVGGGVFGTFLR